MSLAVLNVWVMHIWSSAERAPACSLQFLSDSLLTHIKCCSDKLWFLGKWLFNGKVLSSAGLTKRYSLLINSALRDNVRLISANTPIFIEIPSFEIHSEIVAASTVLKVLEVSYKTPVLYWIQYSWTCHGLAGSKSSRDTWKWGFHTETREALGLPDPRTVAGEGPVGSHLGFFVGILAVWFLGWLPGWFLGFFGGLRDSIPKPASSSQNQSKLVQTHLNRSKMVQKRSKWVQSQTSPFIFNQSKPVKNSINCL